MSVQFISDDKVLGQVATERGWRDVARYVRTMKDVPHLRQLVDEAASESVKELRKETDYAERECRDDGVRSTLLNLEHLLSTAGKLVVIE